MTTDRSRVYCLSQEQNQPQDLVIVLAVIVHNKITDDPFSPEQDCNDLK